MLDRSVTAVMAGDYRTVEETTKLRSASEALSAAGADCLLAVSPDGDRMTGIVTPTDVLERLSTDDGLASSTVADVMTSPVVTVNQRDSVSVAAELMKTHDVCRLPVVDDRSVVGIVTTAELTAHLPAVRTAIVKRRIERGRD